MAIQHSWKQKEERDGKKTPLKNLTRHLSINQRPYLKPTI